MRIIYKKLQIKNLVLQQKNLGFGDGRIQKKTSVSASDTVTTLLIYKALHILSPL